VPTLTHAEVARLRLARQRLAGPPAGTPLDVVRSLGAVQAQDYAAAKWAVGQRARGATDDDVERLVTEGSVVRTHVLRPTWHFVAAEDVRWMLALTAPRVKATMASSDRRLGLDDATYRRGTDAIAAVLCGGAHRTRSSSSA
jgi:hypothetical protein